MAAEFFAQNAVLRAAARPGSARMRSFATAVGDGDGIEAAGFLGVGRQVAARKWRSVAIRAASAKFCGHRHDLGRLGIVSPSWLPPAWPSARGYRLRRGTVKRPVQAAVRQRRTARGPDRTGGGAALREWHSRTGQVPAPPCRPSCRPPSPVRQRWLGQTFEEEEICTPSASAISHRRDALTRFIPVSYFWICWNLIPTLSASCCCVMPTIQRR